MTLAGAVTDGFRMSQAYAQEGENQCDGNNPGFECAYFHGTPRIKIYRFNIDRRTPLVNKKTGPRREGPEKMRVFDSKTFVTYR
jgi:hypothetical protein